MRIWHNIYSNIITLEGVFKAWDEFIVGKKKKTDVVTFGRFLEDNLFELHNDLKNKTYKHGGYKSFHIRDPKVRCISKACVRDRVVHHLMSNILEKIFDSTFYVHSYSCRREKGTHKVVGAFIKLSRKASKNKSSSLFTLKCDIKKFFASVDHEILLNLLNKRIQDKDFLWLLREIISREYLDELVIKIKEFLEFNLKLSLHPQKIDVRDYYLGTDFLGYVIFPNFIVPRTKTKRRMFKKIYLKVQLYKMSKISSESLNQSIQSYLGYLTHANAYKLSQQLKNHVIFWLND